MEEGVERRKQVKRLKQEKNNILEGCREAFKINEGIEHRCEKCRTP
jgi:SMC interacting uncharacterized protein involved in chromosome segregation